jgi:hypothetical protein
MKKTYLVGGLALAAAVTVVACSSGPTTYNFVGGCSGVTVSLGGGGVQLSGPCTLGSAGNYTIGVAALPVSIGTCGHTLVPSTVATWTQSGSEINSTFVGAADVPCTDAGVIDLTKVIGLNGAFVYDGGTGPFAMAYGGAAVVDGGVSTTDGRTFTANLPVAGSLVY